MFIKLTNYFTSRKKAVHNSKGFTLLETLIAVFILTLALTGPIYIATLSIRSSVESRDNISAYYIAEEVVESVRNMRDTNSLKGIDWMDGLRDCYVQTGVDPIFCYMTTDDGQSYNSIGQCGGDCPKLILNPSGSVIYGSSGTGIESKFSRDFYLQEVVADREVLLVVTVRWKDKGINKSFSISERLHDQKYSDYYNEFNT